MKTSDIGSMIDVNYAEARITYLKRYLDRPWEVIQDYASEGQFGEPRLSIKSDLRPGLNIAARALFNTAKIKVRVTAPTAPNTDDRFDSHYEWGIECAQPAETKARMLALYTSDSEDPWKEMDYITLVIRDMDLSTEKEYRIMSDDVLMDLDPDWVFRNKVNLSKMVRHMAKIEDPHFRMVMIQAYGINTDGFIDALKTYLDTGKLPAMPSKPIRKGLHRVDDTEE